MLNEADLIAGLQQKQEPAFRQLVDLYRDKVYATAFNMLQNQAEAEDTAQEVFIRVYETIGRFRQESSLGTWIYSVTVRRSIDKLRSRKIRQRLTHWLPSWMPQENHSTNEAFMHPGIRAEQKESIVALFKAVQQLPSKQQTAFTLVKLQGLKYEEVAGIMALSVKAVESLVVRAKSQLQKQIDKNYHS